MNMTRLVPMLPVQHLERSLEFYQKLGFGLEQRRDDWGWASLRMDGCEIMLDQSIYVGAAGAVLYLYPEDIFSYHQQVRQNGLEVPSLEPKFYGLVEFRLRDPDGNQIWVGQAVASETQI